jgi:hypothetical protein
MCLCVCAFVTANLLISTVKEVSSIEFQIISPGQRKNGVNSGGGVYSLQVAGACLSHCVCGSRKSRLILFRCVIPSQGESDLVVREWVSFIRSGIQKSLVSNVATGSSFRQLPGVSGAAGASRDGADTTVFKTLTQEQLHAIYSHNPTCADCNAPRPDWCVRILLYTVPLMT